MAKRHLQLVHYIMSNSSIPFLWFRSTTGERGKNLHLICSLASAHQCFSSSLPLIKAAEETCLFSPFLFNLKCTVALHSEPPSYMYPCHVAFSKFITAIQVNSSGLRACGSQSINSCRTLVELNIPVLRSNPLNPSECSVLLAVPVERENTVANAVAAPNIPG